MGLEHDSDSQDTSGDGDLDQSAVPLQDNTKNPNKPPDLKAPDIELQPGTRGISPSRHGPDFMRNRRGDSTAGIFKPADVEAKEAICLKQGTKLGKAALAEVACFLLDHPRSGPRVDDDIKGGVTIKILYDDALLKVVVEGDMKKGFSSHGVPLTIGILYQGAFCEVVHSEMKNGLSAPGVAVPIEFLYNGALWKVVVEGNMKKGFSTRGGPLIIGIMFVGAFRQVVFDDGKTNNGFSGVPLLTVMAGCLNKAFNHPQGFNGENLNIKVGSLQRYIRNSRSCAGVKDPWNFPVAEVHKIAVLDLRVGNADRHAANILWKRRRDGSYELIPIDHGYCLPESIEDFRFVWLEWPQARQQFSVETLDYIKSLDAEKDIKLLESTQLNFSKLSLRNLRMLTKLLKHGAKRKLSPYQIGGILCRDSHGNSSVIEKVIAEAQKIIHPEVNEAWFLTCVADLLSVELDKVAMTPLQLKD